MRTLGRNPASAGFFIGREAYGALIRAQPVRFKPRRRPSPRQPRGIVADILGPGRDLFRVALAIVGIQRARGFLESGQVAGQAAHEEIGGFLPFACGRGLHCRGAPVRPACAAPPTRRRAARQPVPVARQQRHSRGTTPSRGGRAARASVWRRPTLGYRRQLGRRRVARDDFLVGAAQVQVDLVAGPVIEDQHGADGEEGGRA